MSAETTPGKAAVADAPEMIDLVFDLQASLVPENYPFQLWTEVSRHLPWAQDQQSIGILPLRGSISSENILLSKRTKLILRVPLEFEVKTQVLAGKKLNVGGQILEVGQGKAREIQAATTVHAYMVESNLGEVEFIADMQQKLQAMNIACNLICDKYRKINGATESLTGYGLVLHDLKPQSSLQIQRSGLGGARHYGCGIFVPFKAISGLE